MCVNDLKERMVKDYCTYTQVNETIRINLGEVEKKFYAQNERRMQEVMESYNKRLPPENALKLLNSMSSHFENIEAFQKQLKILDRGFTENRNRIDIS